MHKISASCIDASRLFFPDSIRSFQTFYAVMSDYYFGLEFLKAYPGVYTTVFPWLSERMDVLPPFRGTGSAVPLLSARYAVTSNFAITYIR